jgi:L-threonylcarbamoyladenylate synthase
MTSPRTSSLADIEEAVSVLRAGGVIAMPTDTLYALAASARAAAAVRRVFQIKGREAGKPLPLFVADIEMAEQIALLDKTARRLAERFWPGALTIVLPKRPEFASLALAGGETVALRVPAHAVAIAVLETLDGPITATSANRSGGPDPDTAAEVRRQLGNDVDLVIDAGACPAGVASTIVDCTRAEPEIQRQGAVDAATIAAALAS